MQNPKKLLSLRSHSGGEKESFSHTLKFFLFYPLNAETKQ